MTTRTRVPASIRQFGRRLEAVAAELLRDAEALRLVATASLGELPADVEPEEVTAALARAESYAQSVEETARTARRRAGALLKSWDARTGG